MKSFELEVRKIKIYCKTEGCMNPSGGHKSTYRNVRDFSRKSKLAAIQAFKAGLRINHTSGNPTQGKWKRTANGWLCPECK